MEELDGICLLSDSGEVFARGLRMGEGQRKCGFWIVGAIGAQRSLCDRAFRLGVYLGSLSLGLCTLEPPHVGREQIGLQFRKSTAGCCEEFGRGAASGPCLRQLAVADIVVAVRFNQEAQLSAEVTYGAGLLIDVEPRRLQRCLGLVESFRFCITGEFSAALPGLGVMQTLSL